MSTLAVLVVAAAVSAAEPAPPADVTFDQSIVTTVDGKAGEPATSRVYWSGRKVRLESGDAFDPLILLLDLARDRAYRLDPAGKKAVVLDVEALRSRSHLGFSLAGDRMGAAEDFRRTRLAEKRTIAGYACEGHVLRAGQTRVEVWVSDRVPVEMDAFAEFLEWSGADASMAGLLPVLTRLGGFPLQTRSRIVVDGHVYETRATVTRLSAQVIEPALFEVPPSFVIQEEADPGP